MQRLIPLIVLAVAMIAAGAPYHAVAAGPEYYLTYYDRDPATKKLVQGYFVPQADGTWLLWDEHSTSANVMTVEKENDDFVQLRGKKIANHRVRLYKRHRARIFRHRQVGQEWTEEFIDPPPRWVILRPPVPPRTR